MTFPLPTALLERLRLVREGAQVLIQVHGPANLEGGPIVQGVRGVRRWRRDVDRRGRTPGAASDAGPERGGL